MRNGYIKILCFASISAFSLLPLAGCTTVQQIKRPNGQKEYLIACGASLGWNICYNKANELCPKGYNTVSEHAGFNRKELKIVCPHASEDQSSSRE